MGKLEGLESAIEHAVDPKLVIDRLVNQVKVLVPKADGVSLELADSDGYLTYVCAAGNLAPHVGTKLRIDGSLSGMAVTSHTTLLCCDIETDSRVDIEVCRRLGIASMVCVPLEVGSGLGGVLKIAASKVGVFDDDDIATMTKLADFVSAVVSSTTDLVNATSKLLSTPQEELERLSRTTQVRGGEQFEVGGPGAVVEFVANILTPGVVGDLAIRQRVERVLADSQFVVVYQPVFDLRSGRLCGVEALARFPGPLQRTPDVWFDEAHRVGLGVDLELALINAVLESIDQLPQGIFLAMNASPQVVGSFRLRAMLKDVDNSRLVVEMTEHAAVEDYGWLVRRLRELRSLGVRLAVDDAGAGFASFSHILKLAPDFIKLDRDLISSIDIDPVRRALAVALVAFARETGADIIAEGIENAGEMETLREMGVQFGQGFHLGYPGSIDDLYWGLRTSQVNSDEVVL